MSAILAGYRINSFAQHFEYSQSGRHLLFERCAHSKWFSTPFYGNKNIVLIQDIVVEHRPRNIRGDPVDIPDEIESRRLDLDLLIIGFFIALDEFCRRHRTQCPVEPFFWPDLPAKFSHAANTI